MREILFRGKRIEDGVWVHGAYMAHDYDGHTIFNQNLEDGTLQGFEVIPETVGQYSGLDDKNNRKIFEGDIVNLKYPRDRRYKVVAKVINGQEISAMVLKFDNDFTTEEFPLYKISAENNLEVIGSVHDNPELVEVSE